MRLCEGRRLTGANLLAKEPLVLVEVALEPDELEAAVAEFRVQLARMRVALGQPAEVDLHVRAHRGGAVFAYAEARDAMLASVDTSEWAAASAADVLAGAAEHALEPKRSEIFATLQRDRNPALVALEDAAARRDVPILIDDEIVSLGHGVHALQFPLGAIPTSIPWERLARIPIALVTGTNGKTTSSRLLAHVAQAAGFVVGSTSTDGVLVGGELVERGDWTGPIAARRVLRDARVELAVLETARGGILRRGLAVDACDVTLITNISADHLGDYGVDDLEGMTQAKGVAAHAATRGVVLNARDPRLLTFSESVQVPVIFFADLQGASADEQARVATLLDAGHMMILARDGQIVVTGGPAKSAGAHERPWASLAELPITFGGAARYNVENVLGAVGAALALGIAEDVIVRALRSFQHTDNPGRGQLLLHQGVRVLLDFGHNPHGIRSVMQLVAALRAERPGRLFVLAASPGDRSDADIVAVVDEIAAAAPDRVILRELTDYLRGRPLGAIPAIYQRRLAERSVAPEQYELADSELDALERALAGARAGDLVVILIHQDEAVRALLAR